MRLFRKLLKPGIAIIVSLSVPGIGSLFHFLQIPDIIGHGLLALMLLLAIGAAIMWLDLMHLTGGRDIVFEIRNTVSAKLFFGIRGFERDKEDIIKKRRKSE